MRKKELGKTKRNKADRGLFILTLILTAVGLIAVADASAPQALSFFKDSYFYAKQQAAWSLVGLLALIVVSNVNYKLWRVLAVPVFFVSVIFLILVVIPGVGSKFLGARRWLSLGPIGFQPSELVKLTLAIYFARLADSQKKLLSFLLILGAVSGLIMLQPDLGTTLIVLGVGMSQIFVSGFPLFYLFGVSLVGAAISFVLILISPYRRERLMTFFESTKDPTGSAYHISQVLIALGSGGLFGVGLGQSRQKYLFLPESATDSVFAVIAEEIGFVGSVALILLFVAFIYKALTIAKRAPDRFSFILAVGITCWIGGQAVLNLSSMVALTPLTGVPLPFFSYGGSSLTMILIGVGILLNISRYGRDQKTQ